jgi:hypothetical protein
MVLVEGWPSACSDIRQGDDAMKYVKLPLPEVALVAATRGMLGAGVALLFGSKLSARGRKALGWTLFIAGAISTIPLARDIKKQIVG